jgi:hypothetical protein
MNYQKFESYRKQKKKMEIENKMYIENSFKLNYDETFFFIVLIDYSLKVNNVVTTMEIHFHINIKRLRFK